MLKEIEGMRQVYEKGLRAMMQSFIEQTFMQKSFVQKNFDFAQQMSELLIPSPSQEPNLLMRSRLEDLATAYATAPANSPAAGSVSEVDSCNWSVVPSADENSAMA